MKEIMEKSYSLKKIVEKTKELGGLVWGAPYYLNLVGIRDLSNPNKFNDKLIYYYWDDKGNLNLKEINGFTTDPGVQCLSSPINSAGCAILKEGWHRKIWKKGLHQGKYDAFVQYATCKVYRDNDKDKEFDLNPKDVQDGMFGINLHRANQNSVAKEVGPHSAGCQVVQHVSDFDELIKVRDLAIKHGMTYFSYMLFTKEQLD